MSMKHPVWYLESDSHGPYICEEGCGRIATIECESFAANGGREDWYRARLMRASPVLHEALEGLRDAVCARAWDLYPHIKTALIQADKALRSMIAKPASADDCGRIPKGQREYP